MSDASPAHTHLFTTQKVGGFSAWPTVDLTPMVRSCELMCMSLLSIICLLPVPIASSLIALVSTLTTNILYLEGKA